VQVVEELTVQTEFHLRKVKDTGNRGAQFELEAVVEQAVLMVLREPEGREGPKVLRAKKYYKPFVKSP
jgi:hypothetical protein